jgi:seryl-tRNA synthetase
LLDIKALRRDAEPFKLSLTARGGDAADVDAVVELDARRRAAIGQMEALRAERRTISKQIGRAKDAETRETLKAQVSGFKADLQALEVLARDLDEQTAGALAKLPNLVDPRVPHGTTEDDNVVIATHGTKPVFPEGFTPKPHWDLGTDLGMIDFERGVKLSGSRFYVLQADLARLQRALIFFLIDLHTTRGGYEELYLPFVVRKQTLFASGQLPKFDDNLYRDHQDDLWLVPTAEVPITNFHGDEILDPGSLPLRYCAYTPCFRREKTSAGKDVRGIKRGHQFDKVEMYAFVAPEDAETELEKMRGDAEAACMALGLPHRVKQLCTADLGFGARMTYDLEVWAAGCDEWLEVSSVSNVGDFQARRAKIRFRRDANGKPELCATLNGSGLGIPRTMIAIMENNQQPDGSIVIPEVLRPFMGGKTVIQAVKKGSSPA